jgi:hypothetical protein
MKFPFLVLLSFVVLLPSSSDGKERYDFEKARVVIRKTVKNASMESITTDTVYIDRFGEREARHSHEVQTVRMLKSTQESRSFSIADGPWITSYDPVTRKGVKMKNPFAETIGKASDDKKKEFARGMSDAFKATTVTLEPETVAGRTCDVTETTTGPQGMETRTKVWTWKGFVMKSVSTGMGSDITEEVLSMEEGENIPADWLIIPDDVELSGYGK